MKCPVCKRLGMLDNNTCMYCGDIGKHQKKPPTSSKTSAAKQEDILQIKDSTTLPIPRIHQETKSQERTTKTQVVESLLHDKIDRETYRLKALERSKEKTRRVLDKWEESSTYSGYLVEESEKPEKLSKSDRIKLIKYAVAVIVMLVVLISRCR